VEPVTDIPQLEAIARQVRGKLVAMSHQAGAPHLGSSLSCVDIVVAAYWSALHIDPADPLNPNRDRFILSKGHAAPSLYIALAMRGFFPPELLDTYSAAGGKLLQHPTLGSVPGVEAATGSLGHGLSMGLGMAIAGKVAHRDYRICAVLSDGECNEGTVWEAAMMAPAQGLERVMAIVDYNKWQATGRSDEVLALGPLREKWASFGWNTYEIDGHDMSALVDVLSKIPDGSGKPIAVIAHTIKGKGVPFMEDDNNWHYRIPTQEEVQQAHEILGLS
jgi:transketolase